MRIVSSLLINGTSPVVIGGTGANLKFFPAVAGTTSSKRGYIFCPGNNQANGQSLYVRANGNFKSSNPIRLGLYAVCPESNLPFALCSEAISGEPCPGPWTLKVEFEGDGESKVVHGHYKIQVVNQVFEGVINPLRNIDFSSDEPFALAVGIQFGTSDNKNKGSMFQFDLSLG